MTPSAFIFLYENQLFLTFRNRTVAVWNFRGELVTSFEDHLLWHPDCNTNNIYITSDQDLIISYCKADSDDSLSEGNGTSLFFYPCLAAPLLGFFCFFLPIIFLLFPRSFKSLNWKADLARCSLSHVI